VRLQSIIFLPFPHVIGLTHLPGHLLLGVDYLGLVRVPEQGVEQALEGHAVVVVKVGQGALLASRLGLTVELGVIRSLL